MKFKSFIFLFVFLVEVLHPSSRFVRTGVEKNLFYKLTIQRTATAPRLHFCSYAVKQRFKEKCSITVETTHSATPYILYQFEPTGLVAGHFQFYQNVSIKEFLNRLERPPISPAV